MPEALLEISGLGVEFSARRRAWRFGRRPKSIVALRDINLYVTEGEILGVIGESGSGKSTLANAILRVAPITAGSLRYRGVDITRLTRRDLQPFRGKMQMIFQDSHSALNPRKTVEATLIATLRMRGVATRMLRPKALELLETVGLRPALGQRFPHELSGGQRQRVGIARAIGMEPEFLIADEPVSALDVSLQGQILNLLLRLHSERRLTMVLISHDLAVVKHVSTRVAVMYAGRIVEAAGVNDLVERPMHPYTRALLAAVPKGLAGRTPLTGETLGEGARGTPYLADGCPFADRCPHAMGKCTQMEPMARDISQGHSVACHLY